MFQPPPADQSTFESQAQYNLQATEDVEDDDQNSVEEKKKKRYSVKLSKRPNYRPKPLRWPFIVSMILLLSALMGLVIYATATMPNSDSTAIIEPRRLLMNRQDVSADGQPSSAAAAAPASSPSPTQVNPSPALVSSTPVEDDVIASGTADLPKKPETQIPATPTAAVVDPSVAAPSPTAPGPTTTQQPSSVVPDASKKDATLPTTDSPQITQTSGTVEAIEHNSIASGGSLKESGADEMQSSTTTSLAPSGPSSSPLRETSTTKTEVSVTQTKSDSDAMRKLGRISHSSSSTSDGRSNEPSSSSADPSDQRKAPPVITTTVSQSRTRSSSSSRSTRDDEIISVITSEFTSTITKPASTLTYTTVFVTNVSSTYTTTLKTTFPGTTGETTFTNVLTTSIPHVTTKTPAVSYSLTTMTMPGTTEVRTDTISDEKTTYFETTTKTAGVVTVSSSAVTAPAVVETSFEQVETTYTSTAAFTMPGKTSEFTSVVVSVAPSTVSSIATTTQPGQVYVQVGTTEITRIITVPGGQSDNNRHTQAPVLAVITSVIDGKVETVVEKGAPQTIVTNDAGFVSVVFTPPPETRVTRDGGQQTEMVITVTPSPEAAFFAVPTTIKGTPTVVMVASTPDAAAAVFKEVPTTIDGKATVVNVQVTPEPVLVAVQTTIDGKPTVVLVQSTPTAPGFQPISLTIVSQVGGSTGVFTVTDAPETIKTTIDGKETTIVRTPPPRVFTSVSGGMPTTVALVTTPTGTMPLSFTVVTTTGGTVSTIVSTPKPTTLVTSISGKLRTITSTPKPTTRLSTIKPSTTTITSTTNPTSTDIPETVITQVERFAFTDGDYFVGKFLPVILAVIIAVPLRIIDLNAKLYQPFYALAQEGGSLGRNSMALHFDGWKGFLAPFEVLMQGHPVPFITTLMIWCSSFLAPLATEAIGMKLHGKCKITAIDGCGIQLGVSTMSAHALVALLGLIIVMLLILLFFLRNWETGLHANPWSIAGISSLARNADVRSHQLDFKASEKAMLEKRYYIGYFENKQGRDEYGIIYYDDSAQSLQHEATAAAAAAASGALPADEEMTGAYQRDIAKRRRSKPVPFIALTYWWRLVFMFFLASMFVIILYYHITLGVHTSFKDFMDSQTFGVRFFFAALGVTVIFCWQSIFISVAVISPYYHMARRSQAPERSILLTRPTNGFYGIYSAVLQGDVVLMLVAFMSILAEFLPILFANVPYNLTQTLAAHTVCARISLSILALMLLTVAASLFVKWPEMPVDPRSIAGAMYYVDESRMLDDFEGLSGLGSAERARRVRELGRRYFYGSISGAEGKRMGVESVESIEDTAYTGGHWFMPHHPPREAGRESHEEPRAYFEDYLHGLATESHILQSIEEVHEGEEGRGAPRGSQETREGQHGTGGFM